LGVVGGLGFDEGWWVGEEGGVGEGMFTLEGIVAAWAKACACLIGCEVDGVAMDRVQGLGIFEECEVAQSDKAGMTNWG